VVEPAALAIGGFIAAVNGWALSSALSGVMDFRTRQVTRKKDPEWFWITVIVSAIIFGMGAAIVVMGLGEPPLVGAPVGLATVALWLWAIKSR
jgi:uncharacterized membrane protein YedE/YeeE